MPRLGFGEFSAGGGFQYEGNFEVTDAKIAVVQLPPNQKTGKQSDPFPALVFEGYKLDEHWDREEGDELKRIEFRIASNLENFRPGNLNNPDDLDEDPEDLGREVGTEGNSMYAEAGKKPFEDSAFSMLMKSLLNPGGFKPAEIAKGYAPSFIGMKLKFKIVDMKEYKDKNTGQPVKPTTSVCDGAIHTYPYEVKKGGNGKGGNGAAKGAAKTTTKPATKPEPTQSAGDASDPSELMTFAAASIANHADMMAKSAPAGTPVKSAVLKQKVQMFMLMDKLEKDTQKAVNEAMKEDDNLSLLGTMANFIYDAEAGTVTFQE